MATNIELVQGGNRRAMETLYAANKQKVYYFGVLLGGNAKEAELATVNAFKNVWGNISAHGIKTEDEFSNLLLRKVTDYCKNKILKKDAKAFRIPDKRNFLIGNIGTASAKKTASAAETVNLLPVLQRYILILHTVGGYLPEQIAGTFKFDMKTVGLALEVEGTNVERILSQTAQSGKNYAKILDELRAGEAQTDVPDYIDTAVLAIIDSIAKPIEEREKKKIIKMGAIFGAVFVLVLGIALIASLGSGNSSTDDDYDDYYDDTTDGDETLDPSIIYEPIIDLDETLTYYADIEIADYGTVTVELDPTAAPVTVSNFVNLAQNGFYDGLTFHRIMENFMMQGGDPYGDGTGGNTEENGDEVNIVGEFTYNGYDNTLSHTRGAISMARADDYNSASSQFFIVHEDSTSLDGEYAVFGYVTEGMDVVDAVCEVAYTMDENEIIAEDEQPIITSITIRTEQNEEAVSNTATETNESIELETSETEAEDENTSDSTTEAAGE